MVDSRRSRLLPLSLVLAAALHSGLTSKLQAAEPAEKFLEALRERGYHDMAVEYLERMKTSPMAPVEFKEILLYEIGTTLIMDSREQGDMAIREKRLDEAQDALRRFVGMHPEHDLVSSANSQLGNLLVERARIKIEQSKSASADKAALMDEAKSIYDEAYKVFARSQNELKERLAKMTVIPESDKKGIELRDRLRKDYLQTQLLAAAIKEERADTAGKGSTDYIADLQTAADEYGSIYEKYRTRIAGLYARMYQGRCYEKMGKYKDALSFLGELLEQPDEHPAFRDMKTKAFLLASSAWVNSNPPLYVEAVKKLGDWIAQGRPNEVKTDDWLKLRLELAKIQWEYAKDLEKKNAKDPQVKRSQTEAAKNATYVSRIPEAGDLQKEAQRLLADWGRIQTSPDDRPDPKTFAEAKAAGRESLDEMQTAQMMLSRKSSDAAALEEAKEAAQSAQEDAINYFRLALTLGDPVEDYKDMNVVRYFLCYLYYVRNDFPQAALLGEFIARRFPDSPGARPSAKISMAAYLKMYTESESPDKEFETQRIVRIAKYITEKWQDQPEAVEALNTLIPFMIQANNLDMAEQYLNEIPEDSPKRGDAEIKTGQAMWSAYLRGMADVRKWKNNEEPVPEGVDVAAKETTLEDLKTRAQKILVNGVERMKASGAINDAVATAALSLAQIYIDTQQAEKAVELLEDATIGPLTLVQSDHAAAQREGFAAETYKSALRAYISSLATASDSDAVIKKATDVMDAMKAAIEQKMLIAMYVSLARDLQQQMQLADAAAKKSLSKGFETFLKQLRSGATEFSVLNWVAETFAGIAEGFDTGGPLTPEAKQYFQEAADTYDTILTKSSFDDPDLKTQVMLRQAVTKQRLGKFTDAKQAYLDILSANNMMLNVQIEAAKMYQQWASFPGKEDLYLTALSGTETDPQTKKNIIWGWGRLALITAKYPKFRDVFHQARYNLALCRFNYAKAKSGSTEKEYAAKAKQDIVRTQQLYGSGPEWDKWKPKYNDLMKLIQRSLGERPVGLEDKASTAATASSTTTK